jgi:hypothetical protein
MRSFPSSADPAIIRQIGIIGAITSLYSQKNNQIIFVQKLNYSKKGLH